MVGYTLGLRNVSGEQPSAAADSPCPTAPHANVPFRSSPAFALPTTRKPFQASPFLPDAVAILFGTRLMLCSALLQWLRCLFVLLSGFFIGMAF
jgi:hypothetical protein